VRLAAFIQVEAKMMRVRDGQTLWDEHDTFLGQGRYLFSEYEKDGGTLRREVTQTIEHAGGRIASKLVYPKETK
jgi:hypothetical protein